MRMTDTYTTAFGTLLRLHRRRAALTQEGLAEVAGFSPEYIRKLEGGSRRPSDASFEVLAAALELDMESRGRLREAWNALPAATSGETNRRRSNLPVPVSTFIGRERELSELHGLLRNPSVRLLTLTGPGGTGKTRLAIEAARAAITDFADGVFMVELASLSEPEQVMAAVRSAMKIGEVASGELAAVTGWLAGKRVLLVIDNLEHLLLAAPELLSILKQCPHVTTLVTSRSSIGVSGEHVYEVPPMETPERLASQDQEDTLRCDSIRLFVARANERRIDFRLTAGNQPDVAGICIRLDGLPLAIELAAASVRMFSPRRILESIETLGPVKGLPAGDQFRPQRHQTLDQAIEWSYRLLPAEVKFMFLRAAIFRGGFTLEALSEVCHKPAGTVGRGLAELVEGSLVRQGQECEDPSGEVRFSMLEILQAFAALKLSDSERMNAEQSHARYFLRLAENAYPALNGARRAETLDRLEAERDNITAAIERLAEHGDRVQASQLGGLVWPLWHDRGFRSHGRATLRRALPALADETPDDIRSLRGAAVLAMHSGDLEDATQLLSRAVVQCRNGRQPVELIHTLRALSGLSELRDDADGMSQFATEALAIAETLSDDGLIARTASDVGVGLLAAGRGADAEGYIERSIAAARRAGLQDLLIIDLGNLAWLRLKPGDREGAEEAAREAYQVGLQEGGAWPRGISSLNLGGVLLWSRPAEACKYLRESLSYFQELDDIEDELFGCELLGVGHALSGREQLAAEIWGATETLRISLCLPGLSDNRSYWECELVAARLRVGDDVWETEWLRGQEMTLDDLVALVLRD